MAEAAEGITVESDRRVEALRVAVNDAVQQLRAATFTLVSFRRKWLGLLLTAEAAVVCYSRVYLGAHYPMDVLGGILIGSAVALLGTYVLERYLRRQLEVLERLLSRILRRGLVDF